MKNIMQGDAYSIPIRISSGETGITPEMVEVLEIMIGDVAKTYPGEIVYDGCWRFPLTQLETFRLEPHLQPVQVRIRFSTGEIIGTKCGCINVCDSSSKVVL